jgi:hypothetical protein
MFTRIVSQLSLSPSAGSQLAFYARRLSKESVTRTFSAFAAVLIIFLQIGTIVAPPSTANAASPNDIIYGGVVSKADLLNHWDSSSELRDIYGHWGVTRQNIVDSHETTINSTDHSLKSLGRLQHLSTDTPIDISSTTYWQRALYTWDTGSFIKSGSTYSVFEGTTSTGQWFAIMLACGNIVVKQNPTPPPPPPPPAPKPTPKPPTPSPTPTPKVPTISCTELQGNTTMGEAPLQVDFKGYGEATGETIKDYDFAFGDGGSQKGASDTASYTYTKAGNYTAVLQLTSSTGTTTATTKPCSFAVQVTPTPAVFLKHKYATNLTQNIDATTAPAHAGDVIQYTLVTKNVGGSDTNYAVTEHLDYVLQYSDLTNANGGTLNGAVLSWPSQDLKPGATITKVFTVTVKNPIPPTPVGQSDPASFNLTMDNVYGNTVQIQLQPPIATEVEAASTSLPDTGASTSTTIVLVVSGLTLFFWLRNRQLVKEVKLLRRDFGAN